MMGLNISEYKALTVLDFWCGTDAEIKGLATQSRQSKKNHRDFTKLQQLIISVLRNVY
jgi:hypothetical protein